MAGINRLFRNLDKNTSEIIRRSSATLAVKLLGMCASLAVSIILGRSLGPEGLGIISLSNQIVAILLVLILLGMNNVIVKEVAIANEVNDTQKIANTVFTAFLINVPLALTVTTVFILLAPFLSDQVFHEKSLIIPLTISLALLVPQTASRIMSAALNGFSKVWQSSLVHETLSLTIVAGLLVVMQALAIEVNIVAVAIVYAVARLCVTTTMIFYWRRTFKFSGKYSFHPRSMLLVALPLLVVSSTSLIASNADIVMLGWLSSTYEVGIYTVAARLAMLTSLFNLITASSISPKIATLYSNGKINELSSMVQQITKGLSLIGILSVGFFFFFGRDILSIWGEGFNSAFWILVTLSVGQFFNIATGCTGVVLIMTGHQREIGLISCFSVILNLALNYVLIIRYGALGAAVATAITVTVENIVKLVVVKIKLGISTITIS